MIPLGLKNALESGQAVLFLGAGIGYNALDASGNKMPDGRRLAVEMAEAFGIDAGGSSDLAKVSEIVELRKGRAELTAFLSGRLAAFEPDESLRWLLGLTWRAIFTTNYDGVIERAYELAPKPLQTPVTMSSTAEVVSYDPKFQVPVYHIHGALFGISAPYLLITEEDYSRFRERRRMLFEILKREMATSTIIYIGYSHQDPNWRVVLSELRADLVPSTPRQAYRVSPDTEPLDREILEARHITTLDGTLSSFVSEVSAQVGDLRVEPARLSKLRESVPGDLADVFEKYPASLLRLLNSWMYANAAPFGESANVEAFLKGERANWGLIGQGLQFARDVEEKVFESLADFVTSNTKAQPVFAVLAPAGYGITTVLMSLATKLVAEQAGPVFVHRPGTPITPGDIEFACSVLGGRPCFVVDNGADNATGLMGALVRLREVKYSACFLVGERKNEWRQVLAPPKAIEFAIEALSEAEIQRLLACLERHNALGVLGGLDSRLRAAAVREKHGRQLLVAMREATEGRAFDAIIEDEYRSISTPMAQRLYATVCAAYKMRQYIRDAVLSDVLGVEYPKPFKELDSALEGVVEYECVDAAMGTYAARCRHHLIAEIVWERCVRDLEREEILLRVIESLNLNYKIDGDLFDGLVRSDGQVDSLRSFEAKVRFFEEACEKDPRSPYVRQHYARMLLREGKLDLALGEVTNALQMSPGVRVLNHTKGVILREMALTNPSLELARRRLAQSEEAFREAIRRGKRDAYAYQSLAELYLEWARRTTDESEQVHYVGKCEEVISEGLKNVAQRAGLWIVSAQAQKWLGNRPKAMELLRNAAGSSIAKYLLAKAYLREGNPQKAIVVLQPLVEGNPGDDRIALVYAKALWAKGEPYAKAIAVLQLANLYGMRSPEYVATLGGMLFMDKQFTESARVFESAAEKGFPVEEEQRVHYRPRLGPGDPRPVWQKGNVTAVKPGYAWIGVPGQPGVFCPGSKMRKLIMRTGLSVGFQIAFNARGPVANVVVETA